MDSSAGAFNVHLMTLGDALNNRTSYYSSSWAADGSSTATTASTSAGSSSPATAAGYGLLSTILISAALLFIIVGTVVGNILVCVAVCLVRRLRRPCNYLLVSLAVSDLCVALLVMPMALVYEVLGTWPFGASACDTWVAFDVLSCTASILNLCMISVDRYWAITRPLDYGVKRTPARMISCVALVWISSACISLPPLLVLGNEHGPSAASHPPATTSSSSSILSSNNSQTSPMTMSSNGPLANFIELATAAAGQDYQCQVCQEFGYQIYATLGSFYIPLAVMAAVYYQIFQAAKRIVDEEKKAQSHLLMTRTNSCAKQKAAAAVGGAGQPLQPVQSSLLVHPLHQPSLCTSAAMVVVRRHSDQQLDELGNNIDANNSSLPATNNSAGPALSNNDWRSSRWTNNCNGSIRPTTRPDNHLKQPQQQSQTVDISRHSLAVSTDNVKGETAIPVALNHQIDPLSFQQKHPVLVQSGSSPLPISSTRRNHRSHRLTHRRASRVRLRFALNKERKASTTLGIIMSAFTLCWFPFFVLALVRPFMSHQTASLVIPRWLSSLFLWLGYANSFLNPVIYATTNKDFRLPFREILCLRCKSLNSVMREDFYQSQYGNNQQLGNNNKAGLMAAQLMAAGSGPAASSSPSLKAHRSRRRRRHSSDSLCGEQHRQNYRSKSPASKEVDPATADEEDTTDYGLMSNVHRVSSSSATAFL